MGYKLRNETVSGGRVTDRAVQLYREGVALPRKTYNQQRKHWDISRALHAELRADTSLPCLLDRKPVFLLAVADEGPYRQTWHELKAELEAAHAIA